MKRPKRSRPKSNHGLTSLPNDVTRKIVTRLSPASQASLRATGRALRGVVLAQRPAAGPAAAARRALERFDELDPNQRRAVDAWLAYAAERVRRVRAASTPPTATERRTIRVWARGQIDKLRASPEFDERAHYRRNRQFSTVITVDGELSGQIQTSLLTNRPPFRLMNVLITAYWHGHRKPKISIIDAPGVPLLPVLVAYIVDRMLAKFGSVPVIADQGYRVGARKSANGANLSGYSNDNVSPMSYVRYLSNEPPYRANMANVNFDLEYSMRVSRARKRRNAEFERRA